MIAERHHHHQWRRADMGDVRARFVFHEHLDRAQRDLIAPSWRTSASGFGEPLPRVCGWQHGGPHRVFGNHWYHARRLALITCPAVLEARRLDLGDEIRADQAPRVRVPADQRHLSNDALDSPVDGADHEYMSAAVARAPDADALGINLGKAARPGDRVSVIADLLPRVDFLPRLPIASAEVAVVEYHRADAGLGKSFGEPVEIHLLHGRVSVGHYHGRRAPRAFLNVMPAAKDNSILGAELDIASHGGPLLPRFVNDLCRASLGGLRLEPVDDLCASGLPHALARADMSEHFIEMPDTPGLAHDPRVQMQYHQPPGGRAVGIEPVEPLAPQQVDFVDRTPAVQVDVVVVEIGVDAEREELPGLWGHLIRLLVVAPVAHVADTFLREE